MKRNMTCLTAYNGCIRPSRTGYSPVRAKALRRRPGVARSVGLLVVLALIGAGVAGFFLVVGADKPAPSLRIVSPTPDSTVQPGMTSVTVEVRNAHLGKGTAAGTGYHLHYYLNAVVPTSKGQPAIPSTGRYVSTTSTSHEWRIEDEGLHVLAVQLVTDADLPLDPPVVRSVTVRVPRPPSTPLPPSKPATSPAPMGGGC